MLYNFLTTALWRGALQRASVMAIPHASIARLSSFMMLLDPDPFGEITASLSRDTCRGMRDIVRMLSGGLLCCFVLCCRLSAELL